jgi:HEAT repeat protein
MAAAGRRTRAKWIAVVCALGVLLVGLAGVHEGVRFVRESRAIAALESKDEGERTAALRELAQLRSLRGVPPILSTMPSDAKSERVIWNLGYHKPENTSFTPWEDLCARTILEIGPGAIQLLRRALRSPNAAERFWSACILLRFSEQGRREPDPDLHSLLGDSDSDVGFVAAVSVGLSAEKNHRLLESLVADLRGPRSSENLRRSAALAIDIAAGPHEWRGKFELGDMRPVLEEEKRVPSPEMTPAMRSAALALLEAAEDPSEALRYMAQQALCTIRSEWTLGYLDLEADIRSIIRRGLSHEDVSRRRTSLSWIYHVYDPQAGTVPIDVLEVLGGLLEDGNEEVQRKTHFYLTHPRAIPVLLRVLAGNDIVASSKATEILDTLSENGEQEGRQATLAGLSQALASKEPGIRRAAAQVLARYHAIRFEEVAPLLSPLLHDDDEEVLAHAAWALSNTDDLPADIFDARVLKLLAPTKPLSMRLVACTAAENLGTQARKAIPALIAAAEGDPPQLAAAAIEALAVVSPEESLTFSMRALGHESPEVRDAAVTALWSVGSAAAPALSALRELAEGEKDLDLATRATTLVRRLEAEEGRSSRGPR